jgi:hypothetical protein
MTLIQLAAMTSGSSADPSSCRTGPLQPLDYINLANFVERAELLLHLDNAFGSSRLKWGYYFHLNRAYGLLNRTSPTS